MKYVKLFENHMLDVILDKIFRTGMGSLSTSEKNFLDKFSKGEHQEIEKELNDKKDIYKGILTYDPRKDDTDVYKEIGQQFGIEDMNFNDWTEEEIEENKYCLLWDQLWVEDMDGFLRQYKLPDNVNEIAWDKLPPQIKKSFKTFIKDIGLLD
jgi:hypothetical protein